MVANPQGDLFDQLGSNQQSSGDIFDQINISEKSPSSLRKPLRVGAQYGKGSLNRIPYVAPYNLLTSAVREGAYKSRERVSEQAQKDLAAMDEKLAFGDELTRKERIFYDKTKALAERKNEKAIGIDTDSLINRAVKSATGIDLEPEDLTESIANIVGAITNPSKVVQNVRNIPKLFQKGEVKKLPSGLTQPKVLEAKRPRLGTVTTAQQQRALQNLDKEAADLTKKSIEKNIPLAKQIQEGFDFESKFAKEFSQVDKTAIRANPQINISPVSNLMRETRKKYAGIPNLHSDAKKIGAEMKSFGNRPPTGLGNLVKTYRSNNQKKAQIYETAIVSGKQREYVKFLDDYNRAIADSIKKTLPEDSAWVKMFESSNRDYKNWINAQKTLHNLKGALGEEPNMNKIIKLADDVKAQKKLSYTMGEKGAAEVTQIAKDLKLAKNAIKNIPKKDWGKWDAAMPLAVFIPFVGKPIGMVKGIQAGRSAYGWLLTTPARRKATQEALKAIQQNDLSRYKSATAALGKLIDSEEEPD
jgi:hypothetical protein